VPALAVADALRADGAEVEFVGGDRAERELVPAAGFALHRIGVEGVSRTSPLRALRALVRAALAVPRAGVLLRRVRADAVLGGGGYVAAPVGLAAAALRIPLVLTEADSHLGLANRLLAPFARRVCLAFAIAGRGAPRYRVTGRPLSLAPAQREQARERLGLGARDTCVLVFGGSLGARSVNEAALGAFAGADFDVLHVCGSRDYEQLRARAAREAPRAGYRLIESLPPHEFGAALAAADLAVARAGGSVFEIAAAGVPAVLVPYPHAAADHQRGNARWMADAGAAVVMRDDQLDAASLAHQVGALLSDRGRLRSMAAASRGLARPGAARDVADELLAAAAERRGGA
jgi:UDP-N-acetylglucosamine--N-acetylmuramyl-(pentapeptide) pyrophosphoryl-undecaprenol N-acetylglucosamine transferase